MKWGTKWFHMARYGLILKLDGATWPKIISKPLLTPKKAMEGHAILKKVKHLGQLAKANFSFALWLRNFFCSETCEHSRSLMSSPIKKWYCSKSFLCDILDPRTAKWQPIWSPKEIGGTGRHSGTRAPVVVCWGWALADYSMANRKIAYTLGRGWANIFHPYS